MDQIYGLGPEAALPLLTMFLQCSSDGRWRTDIFYLSDMV